MTAQLEHYVTDVVLTTNLDGSQFEAGFQLVDQLPDGPRRSGKYIRLTMTSAQAMRLLALLHGAQQTHSLLIPADVRLEPVPPPKDRN